MFDSYFKLSEHGSNLRTELIAGVTTFLAMAYIIFVNPEILSASGMDRNSVFVATCLVSAIGSLIMGLYANYPITVAPGMGLNAYFSYTVVGTLGYSWQVALGAVFISGLLFLIISVLPVREWIVNSIPRSQKMAISAINSVRRFEPCSDSWRMSPQRIWDAGPGVRALVRQPRGCWDAGFAACRIRVEVASDSRSCYPARHARGFPRHSGLSAAAYAGLSTARFQP